MSASVSPLLAWSDEEGWPRHAQRRPGEHTWRACLVLGLHPLAVVPVEEEQGEGAHHQEEEDPHPEACIIFDGLGGRSTGVTLLSTGQGFNSPTGPQVPHTPLSVATEVTRLCAALKRWLVTK